MSYHRTSSPGRRAIQNYGRVSDIALGTSTGREAYASPRGSADRVAPAGSSRAGGDRLSVHDGYGRPRRPTVSEYDHLQAQGGPSRAGYVASAGRPASPVTRSREDADGQASKKYYTIGGDKTQLVADFSPSASKSRHSRHESSDRIERSKDHYRRISSDRNGYVVSSPAGRSSKDYHLSGPAPREASSSHATTDPAAQYADEPVRPRRRRGSSVDGPRERPHSMMIESSPRYSQRDLGPPTSRAVDRYNEGVLRSSSVRQGGPRPIQRSAYDDGYNSQDDYADRRKAPRRGQTLPVAGTYDYDSRAPPRSQTIVHDRSADFAEPEGLLDPRGGRYASSYDDRYGRDIRYDDRRDARAHDRAPGPRYKDASVERRGFGIRPVSTDRTAGRGSTEVVDRRADYDDRYAVPPSDAYTAKVRPYDGRPDSGYYRSDKRLDDRTVDDYQDEPKRKEKEYRDIRDDRDPRGDRDARVERPARRHDDYYDKSRDYDKYHDDRPKDKGPERDKERERDRDYDRERKRDADHDDERRRDRDTTEYRDRDRDRDKRAESSRHDNDPYDSKLSGMLPAAMAGGGAAAAAAAYSIGKGYPKRDEERRGDDVAYRDDDRERRQRRDQGSGDEPSTALARIPGSDDEDEDDEDGDVPLDRKYPPSAARPPPAVDPDEDYRRRLQAQQQSLQVRTDEPTSKRAAPQEFARSPRDAAHGERDRPRHERRRERNDDLEDDYERPLPPRDPRKAGSEEVSSADDRHDRSSATPERLQHSGSSEGISDSGDKKRQVRIVEPPVEAEQKPRGILKKPKEQFPEDPHPVREGVAPLNKANASQGIPANARWTKISRDIVNPEALEHAKERFEERKDHVIVLRVVTQEEIQKLADKTREIRSRRERDHQKGKEREARRAARRDADEYTESSEDSSEDEFSERKRAPRMLEAGPPSTSATAGPSSSSTHNASSASGPATSTHATSGLPPPPPGAPPSSSRYATAAKAPVGGSGHRSGADAGDYSRREDDLDDVKDRDRARDREREARDRERDREREREREKDRDRDRDRDRERERERERERDRARDRDRERERDAELRDRERLRDWGRGER